METAEAHTSNVHVLAVQPLISPTQLRQKLALDACASKTVRQARESIRLILRGDDDRMLAIVGPCSIHDPTAALEYAARLGSLQKRLCDELLIVMRVYFEKPRTTVGWKGLINDPMLDGSCDMQLGLQTARKLLLDLAQQGLPAATELLDPIIPQYIADLVAWAAIGARTTESQTHREMASGLSMPVGFKNGTNGGLDVAINAMLASSKPHRFLGIDEEGRVGVVATLGNPDSHLVLRGGEAGPNYDKESIAQARACLDAAGVNSRALVDCSHDNSRKRHENQLEVLESLAQQVDSGSNDILGIMVESHLQAGKQAVRQGQPLEYGKSITDACINMEDTERMLTRLAAAVAARRERRRRATPIATQCA